MASTLMFWNKQNSNNQNGSDAKNTKNGRNWLHAPDVLVNGHVAYLVKFLGSTPVEQAKGIEVVKEAIRRLQFTQQMKKAEGGSNVKTKKVEITVSVDGVAIQEPRTQTILHQFPLHKISYCADEKGVKKFFSFIAKTGTTTPSLSANSDDTHSSNSTDQDGQHECFVFISNKLASDITLTIGQAFDLAYRRYVSDSGKTVEASKLQTQNKQLENTVNVYRQRLKDLSELVPKSDLDKLLLRLGLRDICEVPVLENSIENHTATVNGSKTPDLGIDVSLPNNDDQLLIETSPKHFAPMVPPRNIQNQISSTIEAFKPSSGTKSEGLLLNSDSDSDFDPRAPDNDSPSIGGNKISNDLFGFEPPKQSASQQLFTVSNNTNNSHNSFTNGSVGTTTNGFGAPISPPPILAPPPQKSAPRRTTSTHQNNNATNGNGYQDLFGSAPFNPQACDDTVFDSSFADSTFTVSANSTILSNENFAEKIKVLTINSSKLDTVLSLNNSVYTAPQKTSTPHTATATNTVPTLTKLNPFSSLTAPTKNMLLSNPLVATVKHNVTYDIFQNATDSAGTLTDSISSSMSSNTVTTSHHQQQPAKPPATTSATELSESEALFQDFAQSAFNEFKRDLSNSNQRRNTNVAASLKRPLMMGTKEFGVDKGIANTLGAHDMNSARLITANGPQFRDKTTSKNGLFSSDDLLDTFDPLKKC
ncbi:PTB domain-containing adapter protein ced-6 [Toxorhynchites rutilus septentrionalis]|uniref:PTB domain-containing adapter protein ced-6 n=1 Tax=Toxorhynchites rutilus septentrionalis TaxID=329112 RepID=UPI0024791868|nr:PTB domain-containing adapter protein ced-6 [Toxorhynchites rutilus septentrionalis]XP_055623080.1 PTB domain-containing adapter protein ced-6 [Toxorhynchites rutilus septentrionalis]XP_055623081.1 PTB domain-containing adapter protein ced-6 [Toxorhynchites rutilus septentrionalis]XP_055623082.1 PTB domain-containing adapter protein ced-6 [Toxorhynchites rutilus septentrionalis]XP_055623083.1 PTB domain-containing adapter protein ced-6 [Toxorhynchites rutilus septentrionalis]